MEALGNAVGALLAVLFPLAAFAVFAAGAGIGTALWSIWLPITVPQACLSWACSG